jgi:hypothetical protein
MIAGVIFFRKPDTNCDSVIMKKIWNPGNKSEKKLDNIISGYYITVEVKIRLKNGGNEMKATMRVRANESETKAFVEISFSGHGFDNANEVEKMRKHFSDAEKVGMKWDRGSYRAEIDLTPENAQPFVEYAESHNIEIVM